MELTEREILTYKKANKNYKKQLAEKHNLSHKEIVEKYYHRKTSIVKDIAVKAIHNVIILDNSGSMWGNKFRNALAGVENMISELRKEKLPIYQTFAHFDNTRSIYNGVPVISHSKVALSGFVIPKLIANTATPLYATIIKTLQNINDSHCEDEKVVIHIFTDGGDNKFSLRELETCKELIEKYKDKFTITFIGTRRDVRNMTATLGVDESNTLVHTNTGGDIKKALEKTVLATKSYVKKVEKGEEVLTGFYKQTGEL